MSKPQVLEDAERLPSGTLEAGGVPSPHTASGGATANTRAKNGGNAEPRDVPSAGTATLAPNRKDKQSREAHGQRIFLMISAKSSLFYTRQALASFFRCTEITAADRFILIANDHDASEFRGDSRLEVIENDAPKGFAANVNIALRAARAAAADVLLLNNDMIFTDGWLPPLLQFPNAITLPMCNQHYQYRQGDLDLRPFMDWEQFGGRFDALQRIAGIHRERFGETATQTALLMPFFCVHLPNKILQDVGEFDESFGPAGGEDVDYRLRALLAGYDVACAGRSYVLHFMGKSTWRSGEPATQTAARGLACFSHFRQKWGNDATEIFLATPTSRQRISELGFGHLLARGEFRAVLERCMNDFYISSTREGASNQNPDKYRKDAQPLEQPPEEVFMSLYAAAQLQEAMGRPFEEVIATYLRASDAAPRRAEALHAASRLCRANNKFAEGYEYARRGLTIPLPVSGPFVERWRYDFGLLDEFAVHAYWTERYQDCLDACQRLLREGKMPQDMHHRVKKNAEIAAGKIRLQGNGQWSL